MKKIAALTTVRNSPHFLSKWIEHYGKELGEQNLYIVLDGEDQEMPSIPDGVNLIAIKHIAESRAKGDRSRAKRASNLAQELLETYDIVIGCDVDEFILVDPSVSPSLVSYLSHIEMDGALSVMGIDIIQHPDIELQLDWSKPFLSQRRYGLISDRYTKANIINAPLQWGSGFHRIKRRRVKIDPNLFLFHAGSIDLTELEYRSNDTERNQNGWVNHQARRNKVSTELTKTTIIPGDERFESARKELAIPRSVLGWNKPKPLRKNKAISIPDRFIGLL